ncbi:MAG: hypothetical protein WEB88_15830, partial [Gemmatimonadota bacterium]
LSLAWFVYRSRPERTQNRRLALQLVVEAVVVSILGGVVWFIADAGAVRALTLIAFFLVWPKLWTYYSFLATLDTPLARPLQPRRRLNALLAATLLAAMSVLVWPEWYVGAVAYWPAVGGLHPAPGTGFVPMFWMWGLMWLVGLSLSISALRQARTILRRRQARAFLIAFGTRDISFVLTVALLTVVPPTNPYIHWVLLLFSLTWLVYLPLVGYGILKHQLFDIDLRVKRTVQRSTVLGSFAGAFFIGGEAFEQILPVDGFVLGILAATAVALAFRPLQRLAERVAERAVPGVDESADYLTERRFEVYRDAIEGALADGSISQRERAILGKLQESLGIEPAAARRIEAEVQSVLIPAAGSQPGWITQAAGS